MTWTTSPGDCPFPRRPSGLHLQIRSCWWMYQIPRLCFHYRSDILPLPSPQLSVVSLALNVFSWTEIRWKGVPCTSALYPPGPLTLIFWSFCLVLINKRALPHSSCNLLQNTGPHPCSQPAAHLLFTIPVPDPNTRPSPMVCQCPLIRSWICP